VAIVSHGSVALVVAVLVVAVEVATAHLAALVVDFPDAADVDLGLAAASIRSGA
jgi:hypothetical protein